MDYQDINAATITRWIEDGWEWGKPIDHNTYAKALAGEWDILLTPTRPVPHSWFPEDLRGLRVLGLASGGGQQMPILTARGARCTVLDYTPAQLDADRTVAEREGYDRRLIRPDRAPGVQLLHRGGAAGMARMRTHPAPRRSADGRTRQRRQLHHR